jgi:predicted metal-dependent hydrolase
VVGPVSRARDGQLPLFDAAVQSQQAPAWTVRVSRRARRMTVRVYPGARVEISVPPNTRPRDVEAFVARERAWIAARLEEAKLWEASRADRLPDSIAITAYGEAWQVHYPGGRRALLRESGPGRLALYGDDPDSLRRRLKAWLVELGRRRLGVSLRRLAQEREFVYDRLQVRCQRTRWGSCSRTGTVSLNVCLLFQPPPVVNYLMLHELCHTRHMNHSARFWALVERHEPDWRALDRSLTQGWRNVPSWVFR